MGWGGRWCGVAGWWWVVGGVGWWCVLVGGVVTSAWCVVRGAWRVVGGGWWLVVGGWCGGVVVGNGWGDGWVCVVVEAYVADAHAILLRGRRFKHIQ